MRRAVIIDHEWQGHHETYLCHITAALLGLGWRVTACGRRTDEIRRWIQLRHAPLLERLTVHPIQPAPMDQSRFSHLQGLRLAKRFWQIARDVVIDVQQRVGQPHLLFLPWLDSYLAAGLSAGWVDGTAPCPWTGLYFQPWHANPVIRFKRWRRGPLRPDAALGARSCIGVATLVETAVDPLTAHYDKPAIAFPDFADATPPSDPDWMLELRTRSAGRRVLLLIGSLDGRKGLFTLLEAAQKDQSGRWLFAFVGQPARHVFTAEQNSLLDQICAQPPTNCFVHFHALPNEAVFNAVVRGADALAVVYEDFFFSSNLLTKAALFDKPVIATEQGVIGQRVRRFDLGELIPPRRPDQLLKALPKLLARIRSEPPSRPDYDGYLDLQSPSRLGDALLKLLGPTPV